MFKAEDLSKYNTVIVTLNDDNFSEKSVHGKIESIEYQEITGTDKLVYDFLVIKTDKAYAKFLNDKVVGVRLS